MRISDWSSDVCSSDLGTLLTIPAAKQLGRKPMFAIYFAVATFSIFITFGAPLPPQMRLYSYFLIGLSVFGVFGSFTYYLPELFPTRLRATGAGFCYNIGRSEEHTSELQSLMRSSYAVFCLKKKNHT